jgi:beta-lactamase regulating signal transducer with metallopeptidase domain/biopolymer transport protein ExbD
MNVFHPTMFAGSAFWQPAGEAMLEFLVSGSAVALIFMLIRRVTGRLPATIRYSAASTAMAVLVGLAGYHVWEHWPVSPSPGAAVASGASPAARSEPRAVSPPAVSAAAVTAPAVVASPPLSRFTWEAMKPRLVLVLPALWLIGAPLTALFVGLGWTGAARLRRQSTPLVDETLLARFARCQTLIQVKEVGLAVCERIAAPIVVGVFRPMILLPPALLTSLSAEQWEMILLHELAHVRRLDNLVNLLQRAVETVLFFHPAVWWASRWMRLEREHCCDAAVLRLGTSPQSYAETLAVLALPGIAPQLATAAMANHELLTRMRHILGTEDLPMTISWKKLGLAVAVFAAVGGLVAADWAHSTQRAAAEEQRRADHDSLVELIVRNRLQSSDLLGLVDDPFSLPIGLRQELSTIQRELRELEALRDGDGEKFDQRRTSVLNRLVQLERRTKSVDPLSDFVRRSDRTGEKQSWSPNQMLGPPDVKEHADDPKAWAARKPDQGEEWVRLGFERPIKAAAILIYESFNPGAVTSVRTIGPGGPGESIVWQAAGSPNPIQKKNVLLIPIQEPSHTLVSAVNIHLDERRTPGWNEIDAVALIESETGQPHWANTAQASSTYASVHDEFQFDTTNLPTAETGKPAWSAEQAVGPPDVKVGADDTRAWASATPDGQRETIDLVYDGPVDASAILVFESYNPGALVEVLVSSEGPDAKPRRVLGLGPGGRVTSTYPWDWRSIWKGRDPVQVIEGKGTALIAVPAGTGKVGRVRLVFDSPSVTGWNEIDAVGLIDSKTGQTHWAISATASSSFADVGPPQGMPSFVDVPVTQSPGTPNWHPRQATGAPNVPTAGDDGRAWASSSQDGQQEWLELTYDPPVEASLLLVYESFQPGALVEVQVATEGLGGEPRMTDSIGPAGQRLLGVDIDVVKTVLPFKSVWKGRDSVQIENGKGVAAIPVPAGTGKICRVRLTLDSPAVAGWNELDAVGLLNNASGQVQWASDAKASSWFGEQGMTGTISEGGIGNALVPSPIFAPQYIDVPIVSASEVGGEWESSTPGWHPAQATGVPNVKQAGDNPKAWASATPDGQQEWLELTFDPPVLASSMSIYESYNPGAITEVQIEEVAPIANALPPGEGGFRTLMKGSQLYKQGRNGLGITMVNVKTNIRPIRRVRLLIDSPAHQGWNEIDAVGLLSTTGEMHWAKAAKASSWFGESASAELPSKNSSEVINSLIAVREGQQTSMTYSMKIKSIESFDPKRVSVSVDATMPQQLNVAGLRAGATVAMFRDEFNQLHRAFITVNNQDSTQQDANPLFGPISPVAAPSKTILGGVRVYDVSDLVIASPSAVQGSEEKTVRDQELARLVESYNQLWDKRDFPAAFAAALQASRVAPSEVVVAVMLMKSRIALQFMLADPEKYSLSPILIDVDRAGALSVAGIPLAEESLQDFVSTFTIGSASSCEIKLQVAPECPHGAVTKLLDRCKRAGASNVQLNPAADVDEGDQQAPPLSAIGVSF